MTNKISAWSWTRLQDWRRCPKYFALKNLERIKEPSAPALERGSKIHESAEQYSKGIIKDMPEELARFAATFNELKSKYKKRTGPRVIIEDTWAFRKDWSQTRWDDWNGCWLRIKLDAAYYENKEMTELRVIDWKTGKFREDQAEDYQEQLDLYATGALTIMPHLEVVRPQLVYLDLGITYPEVPKEFLQKDVKKMQKGWEKKVAPMFKDTAFIAKPNSKCKWCFYSGKQCKY